MAIDPTNLRIANQKVRDAPAALFRLNSMGVKSRIVRNAETGIAKKGGFRSHFQGVARRDDHAYLTLSGKADGAVILAAQEGDEFVYRRRKAVVGYNHPGGIQTVGEYVAVPVYGCPRGGAKVLIYDRDLGRCSEHNLEESKAFCLGITNIKYPGDHGERYVMAVVTVSDGTRIDFYRSQPGQDLASRDVTFERFGSWSWEKPDDHRIEEFYGHANSISLLVDEEDNLYLLGLHTIPKSKKLSRAVEKLLGDDHLTATGLGRDRAELFRVHWDSERMGGVTTANPIRVGMEKLAVKKCKCHKAAFRFGASARVTAVDTIELIACEAELLRVRPQKVQIDLFSPADRHRPGNRYRKASGKFEKRAYRGAR